MKVCLGGTFSILHEGHEALLRKAFEVGDSVTIGITTCSMAEKMGKSVAGYDERRSNLEKFLIEKFGRTADIVPLNDKYGAAAEGDFDAIVVSPETVKGAEEINGERRRKGMKELKVIRVPFVLADDGIPVSSSRIRAGEIKNGKRIKPLAVKIDSLDESEIPAVKKAFKKFFPGIAITFGCSKEQEADYTVRFLSEGTRGYCEITDKTGYTTTGEADFNPGMKKNSLTEVVETALIPRLKH